MSSSWILVTWEARSLYTQRAEFFFFEYHKIKCFLLNKELKTALSCLRQVLATKSLLKMLKNTLYLYFNSFSIEFLVVKKRADWKHKTCDVPICFVIYCTNVHCNFLPRLWRHKFWNYSPFLPNQAIFSTWPKIQDKNLRILRTKRAFKKK